MSVGIHAPDSTLHLEYPNRYISSGSAVLGHSHQPSSKTYHRHPSCVRIHPEPGAFQRYFPVFWPSGLGVFNWLYLLVCQISVDLNLEFRHLLWREVSTAVAQSRSASVQSSVPNSLSVLIRMLNIVRLPRPSLRQCRQRR